VVVEAIVPSDKMSRLAAYPSPFRAVWIEFYSDATNPGTGIVKILSIRQPWAHLIVRGAKNIENRSWATKYRGPFLIQASLNVDRQACREYGLDPAELPTGGIVGTAEIINCVTGHRSKWFQGPYGFVLRNRRPLRFTKWPGSLGLRDAPTTLLKRAQIINR
jgi:hypothetical protein